ncbi:MAG: NAD-dependent deacetylase [Gammaproteobacteria bacterium]|jgi:NAD-dependent deacetylase
MPASPFKPAIIDIINNPDKKITVLTGAGISAESGVPTFRGPEGYWTLGSTVYMPEEIATLSMFRKHPQEVWEWYLYRLGVCLHAQPNEGHLALVKLEKLLQDRFTLITQNIDNLHIRAGNSLARTFQVHGNINFTRCSTECHSQLNLLADELKIVREQKQLHAHELRFLHCQRCGSWLRPHVLWFDEYYDETWFRYDSSLKVATNTDLLIIVGTSGATALPNHVTSLVHQNGGTIIDINPDENTFSELAKSSPEGMFIKQSSSVVLPQLTQCFLL